MEEQWHPCEDEIDLRDLALTLWRGRWFFVTATVVAALAALGTNLALDGHGSTGNVALATVLRAMLGLMGVWLAAWWREESVA